MIQIAAIEAWTRAMTRSREAHNFEMGSAKTGRIDLATHAKMEIIPRLLSIAFPCSPSVSWPDIDYSVPCQVAQALILVKP